MYLNKQIKETEYLYYDLNQNIRIGIIKEDIEDNNSGSLDFSYAKDLMDDANTYKTFGETPFDKTINHKTVVYGGGFNPRAANPFYNNSENKYIAKGIERPLRKKIEFQANHKPQILNIIAHDSQRWNKVICLEKFYNRSLY